jgi:hypothetical protein
MAFVPCASSLNYTIWLNLDTIVKPLLQITLIGSYAEPLALHFTEYQILEY